MITKVSNIDTIHTLNEYCRLNNKSIVYNKDKIVHGYIAWDYVV